MCQFDCVTVGNLIDDCYAEAKKIGHPAFYFIWHAGPYRRSSPLHRSPAIGIRRLCRQPGESKNQVAANLPYTKVRH